MKKLLLFTVILLSIHFAKAQEFSPFKVDLAVGGAIPQGSGAKGGVLFALEPKYAVISRLSVGLRLEAAIMARGFVASDGSYASADVSASASYMVTGDYYYSNRTFRPFTGIGIGAYSFANATINNQTVGTSSGAKFGTMVRSGFEVSHFRFAVEYNIVGKNTQSVDDGSGGKTTITSKNSYMGVKIGFFIGGGRRKEQTGTIHM
jgi:outer membrane protein X